VMFVLPAGEELGVESEERADVRPPVTDDE
jgi:hypothetical protein